MKPLCTICGDVWLPSCAEHPITIPYAPLAKRATYLKASHDRRAADAIAARYALEREP